MSAEDPPGGSTLRAAIEINGDLFERTIEPRMLLSDFIRDEVGLKGTHVGCEHGVCGACTVQVDGQPVRSCLVLAVQMRGHAVRTIEGLDSTHDTGGHPLQQSFRECHALQCGFCTPGFLMSLEPVLAESAAWTEAELKSAISGNLCRCTGYINIVAALRRTSELMSNAEEAVSAAVHEPTLRIGYETPVDATADDAWRRLGSLDAIAAALAGWRPVTSDHEHIRFTEVQAGGVDLQCECSVRDLGLDHDTRTAYLAVLARERSGPGIASGLIEARIGASGARTTLTLGGGLSLAGSRTTAAQAHQYGQLLLEQAGAWLARSLASEASAESDDQPQHEAETMKLRNEVVIDASIDHVWPALLDIPRVAHCLPGAGIEKEPVDGVFRGEIKVKIGPIVMHYRGSASLIEVDHESHTAAIELEGRESKGSGTVAAVITNRLVADKGVTRVVAETDLTVTGRAAQFGRGIIQDVAEGLLNEFVQGLERELRTGADSSVSDIDVAKGLSSPVDVLPLGQPDDKSLDALDLGRVVRGVVVRRTPALAVIGILVVLVARLLRRGRACEQIAR